MTKKNKPAYQAKGWISEAIKHCLAVHKWPKKSFKKLKKHNPSSDNIDTYKERKEAQLVTNDWDFQNKWKDYDPFEKP